jgi:hypothetical protein
MKNINIKKIECENIEEFNIIFDTNKKDKIKKIEKTDIQIYVPYTEKYTNINDLDKLYINGPVKTNIYTSLDMAFD